MKAGKLSGGGAFNRRCEKILTDRIGAQALMTTSCTHALEMAAFLLEIRPGDEVIVPSYTFVSSANAFAMRGASICFVDNDQFGNLDLDCVVQAIGTRTKAVVVVHYAGNSTDMERLSDICRTHQIALVEDAAQSVGVEYLGRPLGSFGDYACISFHDTKNATAGEGGALIVRNPEDIERAEIIREKGTNRSQFLQGVVDKYTWVGPGSSYVLSELNAAYLLPQLERLEEINSVRRNIWKIYADTLGRPLESQGCRVLTNPPNNRSNGHLFGILMRDERQRANFISFLRERKVDSYFHYISLHSAPGAQSIPTRFVGGAGKKHCDEFTSCLSRLPLFYNMSHDQLDWTIEVVKDWCKS